LSISRFDEQLNPYLSVKENQIHYYWKGRVALYALLRAMGVREYDEVVMPAYTCVVVPNAVKYLGAKPVYVDVSADTCNMEVGSVKDAITEKTKVIICQSTYGLSSNLDELTRVAREKGIYTIEDCTHGFGGTYNGVHNGSTCDAAFFSTQWNKPFSTGIGGFAVANMPEIAERLSAMAGKLVEPSSKELLNLKLLFFVKRYLINSYSYWPLIRAYRWLSRNNLVVGSSSGEEITSVDMPEGYFKAFSGVQAKEGLRNLSLLSEDLKVRKATAGAYTDTLKGLGKNHVGKALFDNHSFLKYPLLVKDRERFMGLAEKSRITLGDWFMSPLHPVKGDLSAWDYEYGKCPVGERLAKHVINLPTTPDDMGRVIGFLERNVDLIIDV